MSNETKETFDYFYRFLFKDGSAFDYQVQLDAKTLEVQQNKKDPPGPEATPPWTKLDFCQCTNCPLKVQKTPQCPVAVNLQDIVLKFGKIKSYEEVQVEVQSPERVYQKETDLQTGLFSLFGLIMASSPCPKLEFLRPLVRFHLPFASIEETLFRVLSLHFVNEYFACAQGEDHLVSFQGMMEALKEKYLQVTQVNQGMLNRIQHVASGDADKNAFVALDLFIQFFSMEYDSQLDSLANFFRRK